MKFHIRAHEIGDLKAGDYIRFQYGESSALGRVLAIFRRIGTRAVHVKSSIKTHVYEESELELRRWVHIPKPSLWERLWL